MPTTHEQVLPGERARQAIGGGAGWLIIASLALVLLAAISVFAAFLTSPRGAPDLSIAVEAASVAEGRPQLLVQKRSRAWLIKTKDGFRALQDRCTRCGGRLRWYDSRRYFECGADGTLYDPDGVVVRGLTLVPLPEVPTRHEGRWVVVSGR
ncbi:MAG: ubiquinol-cytochrome c reductase iron-sulfur subunit [Armatimonadota bacterium]